MKNKKAEFPESLTLGSSQSIVRPSVDVERAEYEVQSVGLLESLSTLEVSNVGKITKPHKVTLSKVCAYACVCMCMSAYVCTASMLRMRGFSHRSRSMRLTFAGRIH